MQHVVVKCENQNFVFPISRVKYIERVLNVMKLPQTSDTFVGMTDIHGELYSLIDLKQILFGKKGLIEDESRVLIVKGDSKLSFLVDGATDVIDIEESDFALLSSAEEDKASRFISGFAKMEDGIYARLDMDDLLRRGVA